MYKTEVRKVAVLIPTVAVLTLAAPVSANAKLTEKCLAKKKPSHACLNRFGTRFG